MIREIITHISTRVNDESKKNQLETPQNLRIHEHPESPTV